MKKYRIYTKINGRAGVWEAWASSHEEARQHLLAELIIQRVKHSAVLAVLA